MENYLTKFATEAEYNLFAASNDIPYVNVSYVEETDSIKYYKQTISTQPFTVTIVRTPINATTTDLFVGFDGFVNGKYHRSSTDTYYNIQSGDNFKVENVETNEEISFIITCDRITSIGMFTDGGWDNQDFDPQTAGQIAISGNLMSVVNGESYIANPTMKYNFNPSGNRWFRERHIKAILVDASDLWLPTNNLVNECFREMFIGCTVLTSGPNIYAKELPIEACANMFENCTALITMPQIYTESVYDRSFYCTFKNCTSLVNVTPIRVKRQKNLDPGFNGSTGSFMWTFEGCTSLTNTPTWDCYSELNQYISNEFTNGMFNRCTALTTINFEFGPIGSNNNSARWMFEGCTSLQSVIIYDYNSTVEYYPVFKGCTSLTSITNLCNHSLPITDDWSNMSPTGTLYYKVFENMQYNPAEMVGAGWTVTPLSE